MKHIVKLRNPNLVQIVFSTSSYEVGTISLHFSSTLNAEQIDSILQDLRSINDMPIAKADRIIISLNIMNTKAIMSYLISANWIDLDDRPIIGEAIQKIDKEITQRPPVSLSLSDAQKNITLSVAEVYCERIIQVCDDYQTAIKLFRVALHRNLTIYITSMNELLVSKTIDATIMESIITLWKIIHDETKLENSNIRIDKDKLPGVYLQRQIQRKEIIKCCIAKLKEKFPSQDDLIQLYMFLGLYLLLDENQVSLAPLADTDKIIYDALTEQNLSEPTKNFFTFNGHCCSIIFLACKAFIDMGILTQSAPDVARLQSLHQRLNSTALMEYLQELEQLRLGRIEDDNNPLLQALKQNSESKVIEELKRCKDIDQYFNDGLTPLLFSLHNCTPAVIKLVLRAKPDVNKRNQMGMVSPLAVSINKSYVEITRQLLDAGAQLFAICGGVPVINPRRYPPIPELLPGFPIDLAIHKYKQSKSRESAEMVRMFLQYGAGIWYKFDETSAELLEGMVVLGATVPASCKVRPILTAKDFIERVHLDDYSHWESILTKIFIWYTEKKLTMLRGQDPLAPISNMLSLDALNITEVMGTLTHINKHITRNVVQVALNQPFSKLSLNSPITAAGDAHAALLKRTMPLCESSPIICSDFISALQAKNYTKALQATCNIHGELSTQLVRILLSYKDKLPMDLNQQSGNDNRTPAHYAALQGNFEVCDLLQKCGADKNIKDQLGSTADDYLNIHMSVIYKY